MNRPTENQKEKTASSKWFNSMRNSIIPNELHEPAKLQHLVSLQLAKYKKQIPNVVLSDNNHKNYEYLWCCMRLKCCSKCQSWTFIFFILCVSCFIQNLVTSGIGSVVVSTMQKEFYLTSTQSGIFLGIYDFAAFLSSPIIGFIGDLKNVNRMRIISISLLFVTIGSYAIGVTSFAIEPDVTIYSTETSFDYTLCRSNSSINECSSIISKIEGKITQNILLLLCISNMVIGFGSVSLYSIGIAYIEEIVDPSKASVCQAIFYGVGNKQFMHF